MVALGKIYEQYYGWLDHDRGHQLQHQIQNQIAELDQVHEKLTNELKNFKAQTGLVTEIHEFFQSRKELLSLTKSRHLLFCRNGSLVYWTHNESYFDPGWCPCAEDDGQGIFTINDDYHYGLKSKVQKGDFDLCWVLYQKIRTAGSGENMEVNISEVKSEINSLPILNSAKKTIGYLSDTGKGLSRTYSELIISFYLLLLIIFYYPAHFFSKMYFNKKMVSWGFLSLFTGIIATASLAKWLVQDPDYFDSVFTLSRIKTPLFEYTLFELIVFSFLVFHLAYLYHRYFKLPEIQIPEKHSNKYLIPVLNYVVILLALLMYCIVFKTVFVKSEIQFNLQKTIFMPVQNYLILLALMLFLISVFLISHKLFQSTFSFGLTLKERFIGFVGATILFSPVFYASELQIHVVTFYLGSSIIIWLLDYFVEYRQASSMWLITWLLIISFVTSGLIFHYQNIRKRLQKIETVTKSFNQKTGVQDSLELSTPDISALISASIGSDFELFVFEKENLRYSSGYNSPSYQICKKLLRKESEIILREESSEVYIREFKPDYLVVLKHKFPSFVKGISLFSYLFTILIILAYLISLINQKYQILPEGLNIQVTSKPSLRTRIQFYIILGIVFSFLIIALVTVFFTRRSEQQISEESLFNKLRYLSAFLEQSINNADQIEDAHFILKEQIKTTSPLFDYGLEYYDNAGIQIPVYHNPVQQQQKLKLCNPDFYFFHPFSLSDIIMRQSKPEPDRIKLSAYKNIFHNNRRLGTLEMSTFLTQDTSTENRLTNLINTLLNIYVFLFLIAASLATLLANSITSPLEVLSDKIKSMRLGKRNNTLDWAGQDEIGELIQDYNRMVSQLDESASLLAQSERDSAWREMAKQVAHEIKNPLTPMKLNIQYLIQRIKSGDKDIGEFAQKVSQSILEQIEGLSQIATEFSNFAKMPVGVPEKVLINDVVSSVHDLFRKREDLDIHLIVPIDEYYSYCDKNQLVRVLNNLINNAIQAIPDSRRGLIRISLKSKNNMAIISVKDNGIGISDEMKEKVFLPNFTTKSSGTGLGLAMSRQIIESANGSITFESIKDAGTEFFVTLPLIKNESVRDSEISF